MRNGKWFSMLHHAGPCAAHEIVFRQQREHSTCNTIRRLEESAGVQVLGNGFPAELTDGEPEEEGYEVVVMGRG